MGAIFIKLYLDSCSYNLRAIVKTQFKDILNVQETKAKLARKDVCV